MTSKHSFDSVADENTAAPLAPTPDARPPRHLATEPNNDDNPETTPNESVPTPTETTTPTTNETITTPEPEHDATPHHTTNTEPESTPNESVPTPTETTTSELKSSTKQHPTTELENNATSHPTTNETTETPQSSIAADSGSESAAPTTSQRNVNTKVTVSKVLGLLLALAAIIGTVRLMLAAHSSQIIPSRILWPAVVGIGVIVLALSIGLAIVRPKRHRLGYGLMMTAAVIITAGSLFTANVFANVKHFTDGIANGIKDVTITYLIIAPLPPNMTNPDAIGQPSGQTSTPGTTTSTTTPTTKQPTTASTHPTETTSASSTTSPHEQPRTPHTSLEQLTNANIGILLSDPNYKKATKILNNLVTANVVNLNAASDVTVAMSNNTIQGACIDRSIYRLWAEYNPEFFASIEVIKTFEMKITPDPPTPDSSDPATPFVIYISGIDTMEGLDEVGRSDSNMLFAVNPTTGHIALINTPRDYYVQLHDTSGYPDKLTHSGVYGIDMSVGTIEDLYDVEIDYWIRINFASVVDIVNAVGGIDVNVALAFRCYAGAYDWDGYDFHTGLTHMDGSQALCFSRERKAFEDGDRQRGKNQQAVIEALIEKLSRPSILLNYNAVLNALAPNMQTTMPSERITSLARRQLDLGTDWSITEYSVTGSDAYRPSYSLGAREVYVMLPDWGTVSEAKKLLTDVLSGR